MKQLQANIAENKKVADGFYKMRLESTYLAANIEPGQFVEVKCSDGYDPLLRRPLSVHRILKTGIELLYEVVGKGTEALSHRKAGEMLDVIGPLGTGFTLFSNPAQVIHNRRGRLNVPYGCGVAILVAGGIGVAPLLALAERIQGSGFRVQGSGYKIIALIGACTKKHILCESDFKKMGVNVLVSTEDGSRGKKGLVTDILKNFLRTTHNAQRTTIYACGPVAMLKEVARIAGEHRARCQVSLEERMACGVGVCLGCPVKVKTLHASCFTNDEYKMVCKDGPVFNAEDIIW